MATTQATLRPGGLGSPTETEKPSEFAGSMAEAIENALLALLPADRKFATNVNTPEARDRRALFVAIAQGVVKHLKENAAAIAVTHTTGTAIVHKVEITSS